MSAFFHSPAFADVILAAMVLELIWIAAVRRRVMATAFGAVLPGALLVLSLRCVLAGAGWWLAALFAALALPAHLYDLRNRGII